MVRVEELLLDQTQRIEMVRAGELLLDQTRGLTQDLTVILDQVDLMHALKDQVHDLQRVLRDPAVDHLRDQADQVVGPMLDQVDHLHAVRIHALHQGQEVAEAFLEVAVHQDLLVEEAVAEEAAEGEVKRSFP